MRILTLIVQSLMLSLAACGPAERTAKTPEQLEARRVEHIREIATYTQRARDRVVLRMHDEVVSEGPTAAMDILVISGGGDYGAFGAGILNGWGEVAPGKFARPQFGVVTGVSTGALIAPFALVGENNDYDQILRLYTQPSKDWFSLRGLLFFLPGNSSLTDNAGLRKEVEKDMSTEFIARIAEAGRQNRILLIGTTDLDLGVMHPWDLTVEAEKVTTGRSPKRFHDVIMASTAIPAIFPPVEIDGSLYVDGGTTSNILYDSDLRSDEAPVQEYRRDYPGQPLPAIRFWVIVNNQLGGTSRVVQPSWLEVARYSVETAVRSSTIGALKQLALQTELQRRDGLDVEFRYIAIPDDWRPVSQEPFDQDTMRSLADLGRKLGADPASWRTDIISQPKSSDVIGSTPATK